MEMLMEMLTAFVTVCTIEDAPYLSPQCVYFVEKWNQSLVLARQQMTLTRRHLCAHTQFGGCAQRGFFGIARTRIGQCAASTSAAGIRYTNPDPHHSGTYPHHTLHRRPTLYCAKKSLLDIWYTQQNPCRALHNLLDMFYTPRNRICLGSVPRYILRYCQGLPQNALVHFVHIPWRHQYARSTHGHKTYTLSYPVRLDIYRART